MNLTVTVAFVHKECLYFNCMFGLEWSYLCICIHAALTNYIMMCYSIILYVYDNQPKELVY